MWRVAEKSAFDLARDLVHENLWLQGYLDAKPTNTAKLKRIRRKIDRIERQLAARVIFTLAASYDDGDPFDNLDIISKGVINALLRGRRS